MFVQNDFQPKCLANVGPKYVAKEQLTEYGHFQSFFQLDQLFFEKMNYAVLIYNNLIT